MNWKLKAAIQRSCAALPAGQEAVYYSLQRIFGSLRRPVNPIPMWEEAVSIVSDLQAAGFDIHGARVMEIGTGRRLDMPIGLFLCGAASILTVDLHRYLKPDLALQSLRTLAEHREKLRALFLRVTGAAELDERMESLIRAATFQEFLAAARIEYRSPADAAHMDLPDGGIDLQTSYTVFEHIPGPVLAAILREANRLLSKGGVACHHIDPSDHFSHEDPAISAIHFLRYSEAEWDRYAGNQFAYHNRLRTHQYRRIYEECGHEILQWKEIVDSRSLAEIRGGFPLHEEFRPLAPEILSTVVVRAISRPSLLDTDEQRRAAK